jgi:hypothetical protein
MDVDDEGTPAPAKGKGKGKGKSKSKSKSKATAAPSTQAWGVSCVTALVLRCTDKAPSVRAKALQNIAAVIDHFAEDDAHCPGERPPPTLRALHTPAGLLDHCLTL